MEGIAAMMKARVPGRNSSSAAELSEELSPVHVYSMTRDPKVIFRFTRAPGTAMRSPAGT